jgi:hypothetical protein
MVNCVTFQSKVTLQSDKYGIQNFRYEVNAGHSHSEFVYLAGRSKLLIIPQNIHLKMKILIKREFMSLKATIIQFNLAP